MLKEEKVPEVLKNMILKRYPRFGSIIANTNFYFVNETKYGTACTDGKDIFFDKTNYYKMDLEDRLFYVAHEILHIAFEHIYRLEDINGNRRDMETWNTATDAIINANLERDGFKVPEDLIKIEGALEYTSTELYDLLYQPSPEINMNQSSNSSDNNGEEKESNQSGGAKGDNQNSEEKENEENQYNQESSENTNQEEKGDDNSSSSSENVNDEENQEQSEKEQFSSSDHSLWEEAFNKFKEEQENSKEEDKSKEQKEEKSKEEKKSKEQSEEQENTEGNDKTNEEKSDEEGKEKDTKLIEEDKSKEKKDKINENEELTKNRIEKNKQEQNNFKEMKDILSKLFDNSKVRQPFEIVNTGEISDLIDWKQLLIRALYKDEDVWSQRRSIYENNYAYRLIEHEEDDDIETEILLDTSGSISYDLLRNFIKICKGLIKESKLKIGCFDRKFYGFTNIETTKDIDKYTFRGRGGTDFDVAVNAFSKEAHNKIIFTDGYADMPRKKDNIIWIVFGEDKINPLGGTVIYVDERQLEVINSYRKVRK